MSEKQISARTQQKIDLTANWERATNFVPKKGEIIVYSDGGGTGVPKMKVGDGASKVGSLKFADEGQYLPLAGGTLTGPLKRGAITINSQSGSSRNYRYDSLIFYKTSVGATTTNARVAFQYRIISGASSDSGIMCVVAPEFEGNLIGNADTATSASTVNGHTVNSDVPANAKFTDTVYSLPTASSTLGGVKTTSTVSATTGLTACPIIDGVVYYKDANNTYTLAGLVGSTAIGTATNPIYWDGSKFVKTTYTLGKSVPADAKFTDTVYSLPAATTTTLGGIIAGSGLSITTEGKLSVNKVPNALSINGKSFDGSAAIDVGVIEAAYGGSGKTTLSASANAFLNSLPYGSTSETTLTDDHSFYMNGLTGQTNYKVPMSSVYTYVKGKLDSVYQPVGSYLTAIPKATTSVLGGIKLGTGLTAASDGTVNVSVGGATITLKTWTDADVA